MIKTNYAYFVWTIIILSSWLSLLISLWLAFLLGEFRYLAFGVFWFGVVIFMAGITSKSKQPKAVSDLSGKYVELD